MTSVSPLSVANSSQIEKIYRKGATKAKGNLESIKNKTKKLTKSHKQTRSKGKFAPCFLV